MALINCPECAAQVSSAASSCPRCGYPIAARQAPPAPADDRGRRSATDDQGANWKKVRDLYEKIDPQPVEKWAPGQLDEAERGARSEPKKVSRSKDYGRLLAAAIGVWVVVIIVIAAMMGDDDKPTRTAAAPVKKTVPKPIQEVRAVDMVREVQRNEVAFEQAWEGKRALVRGTIQSVEADISDARLTLGANQWDTFAANGIPKNQVVSFRKGQRAEVLCESVGEVLGFAVGSSCTVRKVEP